MFPNLTKVQRHYKDEIWEGYIVGSFRLACGKQFYVIEETKGRIFVSDPSHLKEVNHED